MANSMAVSNGFTRDAASRDGDPEALVRGAKTVDTTNITRCTGSKSFSAGV
jgi:hypothetical protein